MRTSSSHQNVGRCDRAGSPKGRRGVLQRVQTAPSKLLSRALCLLAGVLAPPAARAQNDGSIVGWGWQVVVPQSALTDLVALAGGRFHSLGLKSDGSIVAWGYNGFGQLNVPAPNTGFVALAGGGQNSLGLKGSLCVRDPAWACDGDVDGDGQVNPVDSGLVQSAFGSADEQALCNYDLDCDGQINPVDSGIVQSLFGTCDPVREGCP